MTDRWTDSTQGSHYGKHLLVGERVRLRAPSEDDLHALARWYMDPEFTVLQSGTYTITSEDETFEQFKKWFSNTDKGGSGANFAVEDIASGEVIGGINMFGAKLPQRSATVSMQLGGEHIGRGAGSEALGLAVGFGFRELGLNRIQLEVYAYNSRAIRAYEKVGFVIEGRRRQSVFHDDLVMAILFDDWTAARA